MTVEEIYGDAHDAIAPERMNPAAGGQRETRGPAAGFSLRA
jgi:hypothetical protein